MKATKSILNIQSILKDFSGLAEARKSYTLRTRLVFIFCGITIAMVLFFAHSVVNNAMNKILVVNEGGEFVHFKSMQQDLLYESLLKGHCLFLVNKPDANTVFAKYQADRAYGDALELGVVYKTEFEKIIDIRADGEEYHVRFSSILSIINGDETRKVRILSEGTAIHATPRFPENTSGFFFRTYDQQYELL